MSYLPNIKKIQTGFTLVELIIVISVIAILATVIYTGTSAVLFQARENEVKAALTTSRQKIEDYKKKEGSYPQLAQLPAGTIPANYADDDLHFYQGGYSWCGTGQCYCFELRGVTGLPGNYRQINYHISSVNTDPLPGSCAGYQDEHLGNGLGDDTVTGEGPYATIDVKSVKFIKGSVTFSQSNKPPGFVSTALVRVALYINGTYTSAANLSQYNTYVCQGCGNVVSWSLGAISYPNATAVVKAEWNDPANGWSELASVTLPQPT